MKIVVYLRLFSHTTTRLLVLLLLTILNTPRKNNQTNNTSTKKIFGAITANIAMSSQQRQSVQSIHNKKFWTEFFYLYESLPALWDVNNPVYKNRQVKGDAYDIMVDKLRELEPAADREDVLRKINIFRTNYRRECSRINQSLHEGRHYKSTLWYFDLLLFLQTADTRRVRKRKLLDAGMEKSIMGKRRTLNGITKHSETILVATKKGDIIEYLPHSTHGTDMDYDNYEESDFDYVVEDLSQSLVEPKAERDLQIPIDDYQHLETDEDNSQNDYDQEFQNFAMQTNDAKSLGISQNAKNDLATENMGITSTIGSPNDDEDSGSLIMPNGHMRHYGEYNNEAAAFENHEFLSTNESWCIKATDMPKNLTIDGSKQSLPMSSCVSLSTHDVAPTTTTNLQENDIKITTKMVRNVTTMTSDRANTNSYSAKLSNASEIIAKSWAIQYEEMSQSQKVLARKAINDILFDGCMGRLVTSSNGRVVNCNVLN